MSWQSSTRETPSFTPLDLLSRSATVDEWRVEARAAGFVATREQIVPYRLEFAWWTETSGCSAAVVQALRAHARTASDSVRSAMGLEFDASGDVSAYHLPVLVMRLDPISD